MTLKEMSEKIRKYCESKETCEGCPLRSLLESWCYRDVCKTPEEEAMLVHHYRLIFGEQSSNPYWNNITEIAEKQRAKGMETYGQGLEDNDKPTLDRITYIEEELVDALMYLEWLKEKIADGR